MQVALVKPAAAAVTVVSGGLPEDGRRGPLRCAGENRETRRAERPMTGLRVRLDGAARWLREPEVRVSFIESEQQSLPIEGQIDPRPRYLGRATGAMKEDVLSSRKKRGSSFGVDVP